MDKALKEILSWMSLLVGVALLTTVLPQQATAQDQDDPPGRVARLGYMQGSVSFQPAGESDWVQAVPNRPMTTGDKLWADQDSRAEVATGVCRDPFGSQHRLLVSQPGRSHDADPAHIRFAQY